MMRSFLRGPYFYSTEERDFEVAFSLATRLSRLGK